MLMEVWYTIKDKTDIKGDADIQIYVDGIASMQLQNLNAWVDVARAEIMDKYQPNKHDETAYLLQKNWNGI